MGAKVSDWLPGIIAGTFFHSQSHMTVLMIVQDLVGKFLNCASKGIDVQHVPRKRASPVMEGTGEMAGGSDGHRGVGECQQSGESCLDCLSNLVLDDAKDVPRRNRSLFPGVTAACSRA